MNMTNLMTQLQETAQFIQSKIAAKADTAIILGSGLGNLSTKIETEFEIPYSSIPNFPVSTVEGHKGRLILGTLNGQKVWVLEGRFHFYEGYSPEQVSFPRSASDVNKYKSSSSIYEKGTPIHVRGALLFNYYIKQKNLTNKYSLIQNGEKIKFCYLKLPKHS